MAVELGFVNKCETWRLESKFFPSKVGGKPAWLNLKDIPGERDLQCEYCKEPCIFLCQVYAPYDDNCSAFHRTIYVFVCKKVECCKLNKNGNLKVFRSQLTRANEFYPFKSPIKKKDWRIDISVDQWVKTCHVCGILALKHCSKCKHINYCCRSHQVYDWKNGHKQSCDINQSTIKNSKLLFPEYEIVIKVEDEEEDNNANTSEEDEKEIQKYEIMIEKGKAGIFQNTDLPNELLSMANEMEDEIFSKFRSTIDKYPDQILRYDRAGQILHISVKNDVGEIPKCLDCNGQRIFEFQIMPQLLNFLNFENPLKCIDWGTLVIFTCRNSCIPKNGYSKEYIWKQDIVNNPSNVS